MYAPKLYKTIYKNLQNQLHIFVQFLSQDYKSVTLYSKRKSVFRFVSCISNKRVFMYALNSKKLNHSTQLFK